MNDSKNVSEEIVIVGGRYGAYADEIQSLFNQVAPVEAEDIRKALGDDTVYLMPVPNDYDPYAVGVFSKTQKRLGFVWMRQSHAVREWLDAHQRGYVTVRIKEVNATVNVLMAAPEVPMDLPMKERCCMSLDKCWADHLPIVYNCVSADSFDLSLLLLRDELAVATGWSERLQLRIDNLLGSLPMDLSAHRSQECLEVYRLMKNSEIHDVKRQADLLLLTLVHQGSADHMDWWMRHWLPDYIAQVAESRILRLYESAHYTLERVEDILNRAPDHLFYKYKANPLKFAFTLYYAALPQDVYNRLLTLLAVRELMLEKAGKRNRLEDVEVEEGECVDLCFFSDPCFASVEGQKLLRALLLGILSRMDVDSGRDWVTVYIAYHFFTGQRILMKHYADFFGDIENLLPGVLSRIGKGRKGYNRYRLYIDSITAECDKWFIDKSCLPPMNMWRSNTYMYQVDDDRQDRIQTLVAEVYQGLKRIQRK